MPRTSKGISPIIATVLLIGFAVSVTAIFVNFFQPFQQARQSEVSESGKKEVQCTFASIDYEDSDVDSDLSGSSDSINITVDNAGSVDLYNFEITVWISDVSHSYPLDDGLDFTSSTPLEAGSRATLVANVTDDLSGTIDKTRVIAKNCPRTAKKEVDL